MVKRKIIVPVVLTMMLVLAFSVSAQAAPSVGPKSVECGSVRIAAISGWFNEGTFDHRVRLEQEYTAGGGNCNEWRVVTEVAPHYGGQTLRIQEMYYRSNVGYYESAVWSAYYFANTSDVLFYHTWTDLTHYATGCVWTGWSKVQNAEIYSPYICV